MAVQRKVTTEVLEGFSPAARKRVKRLIVAVRGQEKKGKTQFGLTAPGPIALFDLDTGLEGVIDKFIDQKEIQVASFNYRDATSPKEWEAMWDKMQKAYYVALQSKKIRSIVIDTASEMWELVRLARFGKLDKVQPFHYGPVNAEFRNLIREAYETDKNLILLHKLKREYVDDKATNNYVPSGFGDTPYLVQANILSWRVTGLDNLSGLRRDDGYTGFGITVEDCRMNADLASVELLEPMNSFPFFASQAFPETTEDDWV